MSDRCLKVDLELSADKYVQGATDQLGSSVLL